MKMSKLSNQTNSQDPQAVNSRVFVGNLNTFQCSKTDVERMFQRYGRLVGISMHKGYAFVQFTNPFDARNACHGEDARTVLSQILDVNLVAEPKPHQTGRERQNVSKTGNDWDYYYDSYYASTMFSAATSPPRVAKRQRLMSSPLGRTSSVYQSQQKFTANTILHMQQQPMHQQNALQQPNQLLLSTSPTPNVNLCNSITNHSIAGYNTIDNNRDFSDIESIQPINGQHLTIYSNPDILICGNCRELFSDLNEFLNHKKVYCKIRFTCKCQDQQRSSNNTSSSSKLLCVKCKDSFANPWDLMVHAQADHMINIYGIGDADEDEHNCMSEDISKKNVPISEFNRGDINNGHPNDNHETKLNENLISDNEMEITTITNIHVSAEKNLLKNSDDNQLLATNFELSNSEISTDSLLPSSRSNSLSDSEIDSLPQACIMRTLKMGTSISSGSSAITSLNKSMNNGTALSSLSLQV